MMHASPSPFYPLFAALDVNAKMHEGEYRFCLILWEHGPVAAAQLARLCQEQLGWKRTTTYTVIKKCIDKGAIERREPNFICHATITKQQAQKEEADTLVEKVFGGSAELLFASILSDRSLSKEELARLKALVEEYEG